MNNNIGFIVDVKRYAFKLNFNKSLHDGNSNPHANKSKIFCFMQIAD